MLNAIIIPIFQVIKLGLEKWSYLSEVTQQVMRNDLNPVCLIYTLYKSPLCMEETEGEKQNKSQKEVNW